MHRPIVYTQEQGRSTDFLFGVQQSMVGLAKLAKVVLGSSTIVEGLAVTPTTPASLQVSVAQGQIYQMAPLEATAYGILPADTSDIILKQGVAMTPQTINCPAPTTSGYSINYLIQSTYQDVDAVPAVLPYFNSANPSQPLSGQNNSGSAQNTQRQGVCIVSAKAGVAATTGSQTTPAADTGYVGLYVVTVTYGQTQITGANISQIPGAPIVTNLLQMMQQSAFITANDTGTANAYAITLSPAPVALTPGMLVQIDNIVASNTGASTLNVNGLGVLPIHLSGGIALQGGELFATKDALLRLNHAMSAWELIWTGAGEFVPPAAQSNAAVQAGQLLGAVAVGTQAFVNASSATITTGTFTAPCKGKAILHGFSGSQFLTTSIGLSASLGSINSVVWSTMYYTGIAYGEISMNSGQSSTFSVDVALYNSSDSGIGLAIFVEWVPEPLGGN